LTFGLGFLNSRGSLPGPARASGSGRLVSGCRAGDADDHLAGIPAGPEGIWQGAELEDRRHHRAHLLLVDKNGQLAQLAGVWPDHEVHSPGIVSLAVALGRLFGDRHQGPAPAQHLPGPGHGVAADGVDHDVHIADLLLEVAGVVDDIPGAQPGDEGLVADGCGGGYLGAVQRGELDGVGADAAGAGVDQDVLAGP